MSWTEQEYQRHLAKFTDPHGPAKTPSREQYEKAVATPAKRQKFNARKTQSAAGFWHDSQAEAARFDELTLFMKGGAITCLLPHPSYPLYVNGRRTGRITFDAGYVAECGYIAEDTKSPITAKATAYRQRLRTFKACYPHIQVLEHINGETRVVEV